MSGGATIMRAASAWAVAATPTAAGGEEAAMTVPFASAESRARLARSAGPDFFRLAPRFQPQANPLYCGVATATVVLNAVRQRDGRVPSLPEREVAKPEELGGGTLPFPAYVQESLLDDSTEANKPRAVVRLESRAADGKYDPGLTLRHIASLLEHYGLDVTRTHADGTNESAFRETVAAVLGDEPNFLICNFVGRELGLTTVGHISPVGAYDAATDSVLVLDVAGHKNGWYWVRVGDLYRAMHTQDGDAYRGWLIAAEGTP